MLIMQKFSCAHKGQDVTVTLLERVRAGPSSQISLMVKYENIYFIISDVC